MIQFDPPVVLFKPLSEVDTGSIVRWGTSGNEIAFCVGAHGDPRQALAVYDEERHRFEWQHHEDSTVVSYGSAIIVRPEIDSIVVDQTVRAPDSTLYMLEGAPTVILSVGSNNTMRFLNLSTGIFTGRQGWPLMSGYRNWKAGVRGTDGQFIELLSVFQTDEPDIEIEPDEA